MQNYWKYKFWMFTTVKLLEKYLGLLIVENANNTLHKTILLFVVQRTS